MAKASDDMDWMDELAGARENEMDDGEEHPAEAEAQPDTQEEEAQEEAKPQGDTVPLATLLEERNRQQARIDQLEQRLTDADTRVQSLQSLRDELQALKEAQANPAQPEPDYLEDPKAYIDHTKQTIAEQLEALGNQVKQTEEVQTEAQQQMQRQVAMQRIQAAAAASEEAFAKENQDYWDALDHLRQTREVQLKAMFPQATAEQVQQQMRMEEFQTAATVLQNGGNPAQTAYTLAKTMGYTAQQQQSDAENQEQLDEKRDKAQGMGGSGLPSSPAIDNLMGLEKDEFDQAMAEMFGPAR